MPSDLLQFILKELEAAPDATFSESELIRVSKPTCEALKKGKYLKYVQYDPEKEPFYSDLPGDSGHERFVRKVNGKYTAFSSENDEIAPFVLTQENVTRWSFDINTLLGQIKKENGLARNVDPITSRVYFAGEKTVLQNNVGVFVAFLACDEQAEAELIGLRTKVGKRGDVLVLCPSFAITSLDLLRRLTEQNVVCTAFKDAFAGQDYVIDFSKVQFGQATPKLTNQQIADYDEYKYQCFDRLEIPGTSSFKRSNDLIVNGHTIKMPNKPFPLLIEMVVALKKGQGGWIKKKTQPGKYQIYAYLKNPLGGSLQGKDANKFIQNDAEKRYRISTHPDFVTYDRERLLRHSLSRVRELARKLPK